MTPFLLLAQLVQPCTAATTACERWVSYGAGPARSMVYASYPLDAVNPRITRALIMVHGAGRNADHYFETAMAAAFLAGALDNTIVIAPRYITRADSATTHQGEVVWSSAANNWRSGGFSTTDPQLTSFDFLDRMVRLLADKKTFPSLAKVVVAGHSAGGQVATRYAMANKIDPVPGIAMSYVVANPSSYAWPVAERPLPVGHADPVGADKEALGEDGEKVNGNFQFGPFDTTKAPSFNRWPAGLDSLAGYTAGMSPDQLRKNLVSRTTTYLLGQVDVLPLGDSTALPTRWRRGPPAGRGEKRFSST